MSTIDFTPLFRNSIGFDSLVSVLNSALESSNASSGYPPYNIEVTDENYLDFTKTVQQENFFTKRSFIKTDNLDPGDYKIKLSVNDVNADTFQTKETRFTII